MTNEQSSTTCGFNKIDAAINLEGSSPVYLFGRMDVEFSSNVKILGTPVALKSYVDDIVVISDYEVSFNIRDICETVEINDGDELIRIDYTILSGSSATAHTDFTRLSYCTGSPTQVIICPNYSEADDITVNVDQFELEGNILIPGEFSCSGGSSTDPTEEDWYGFPVGDVNHTCTTCGFKGLPDIHVRSDETRIPVVVQQNDGESFSIKFNHNIGVTVWTMALKVDFPVELVKNIYFNNGLHSSGFLWNIDHTNNLIKLSYVELAGKEVSSFEIKVELSIATTINSEAWFIYQDQLRINNLLIDENKNYYFWDKIIMSTDQEIFLFPNPAKYVLFLSEINKLANEVFIYRLDGRLVSKNRLNSNSIDITHLPQGAYLLRYKDPKHERQFLFTKML